MITPSNPQTAPIGGELLEHIETAKRIAAGHRRLNPHVRFAYHRDGYAVAVWNTVLGRWQACLMLALGKTWLTLDREPGINGRPAVSDADWLEVKEAA